MLHLLDIVHTHHIFKEFVIAQSIDADWWRVESFFRNQDQGLQWSFIEL